MSKSRKAIIERKGIPLYLSKKYESSLIRSLIVRQYGVYIMVQLSSGYYTVMHESGLGNPEVEIVYKCEIVDKIPKRFVSKLEAKAYILDLCSGKLNNFFVQ